VRLFVWMVIGNAIYFFYSRTHSRLVKMTQWDRDEAQELDPIHETVETIALDDEETLIKEPAVTASSSDSKEKNINISANTSSTDE